jgi:hypothetical protein
MPTDVERASCSPRSGGCALDGLLVENRIAAEAHLLLDLVRDASLLHDHVNSRRLVLVHDLSLLFHEFQGTPAFV